MFTKLNPFAKKEKTIADYKQEQPLTKDEILLTFVVKDKIFSYNLSLNSKPETFIRYLSKITSSHRNIRPMKMWYDADFRILTFVMDTIYDKEYLIKILERCLRATDKETEKYITNSIEMYLSSLDASHQAKAHYTQGPLDVTVEFFDENGTIERRTYGLDHRNTKAVIISSLMMFLFCSEDKTIQDSLYHYRIHASYYEFIQKLMKSYESSYVTVDNKREIKGSLYDVTMIRSHVIKIVKKEAIDVVEYPRGNPLDPHLSDATTES